MFPPHYGIYLIVSSSNAGIDTKCRSLTTAFCISVTELYPEKCIHFAAEQIVSLTQVESCRNINFVVSYYLLAITTRRVLIIETLGWYLNTFYKSLSL